MGTVEQINAEGERLSEEIHGFAMLGLATVTNAGRLQARGYEDLAHSALSFAGAIAKTIVELDAKIHGLADAFKAAKAESDELESLLAEPEVGQ